MNLAKSQFLTQLGDELSRAHPKLAMSRRLTFKRCFGAVTGYVDGKIFVSCGKFGIALRLPPDALTRLSQEPGVQPLKYFPNGHIKKEYAVIPKRMVDHRARFRRLVAESVRYALGGASGALSALHPARGRSAKGLTT